jgi:N-succinyldiaminopimelate aminotransferase
MHNGQIDRLTDYPFKRLNTLLSDISPPEEIGTVSMSIGEPQHPAPNIIKRVVSSHSDKWNKYPPTAGTINYRETVKEWLETRYSLQEGILDPVKHILSVAGTREALFMLSHLVAKPSSPERKTRILLPNPYYQVYLGAAIMSGAQHTLMEANKDNNFQPELNKLDRSVLDQTELVFICNPANPQGSIQSIEKLEEIVFLARKHDFIVVSDECYSEIYFDTPPPGLIQACDNMGGDLDNVLIFNSLSKRSNAAGLRAGFVSGDANLINPFLKIRSHAAAVQPLPIMAAAAALWADEKHVEINRKLYIKKFLDAQEIFGVDFDFYIPEGGFFLWLNVGDGCQAARDLWQFEGLKVLPGNYLSQPINGKTTPGDQYIRVALVHDKVTNKSALKRMHRALLQRTEVT